MKTLERVRLFWISWTFLSFSLLAAPNSGASLFDLKDSLRNYLRRNSAEPLNGMALKDVGLIADQRFPFRLVADGSAPAIILPGGDPEAVDSIMFEPQDHGILTIQATVVHDSTSGGLDISVSSGGGRTIDAQTAAQIRWYRKITAYDGEKFNPLTAFSARASQEVRLSLYLDGGKKGSFDLYVDGKLIAEALPWRNPEAESLALRRVGLRNIQRDPAVSVEIRNLRIEHAD